MLLEIPVSAWQVSTDDLDAIALGAGVLGCGGGGPTYLGKLIAREALLAGRPITILPLEAVDPKALVIAVAQVGTPVVFYERLARGSEPGHAYRALETHLGEPAAAVVCDEIGGTNSMTPLWAAANLGVPVLDADAMGRAFPDLYMDTICIYGHGVAPCTFCDDEGNVSVLPATSDHHATERLGRALTIAMGGISYMARPAPRGTERARVMIPGSYSRARAIGRALGTALAEQDLAAADLVPLGGRVLCHGLIRAVERRAVQGPAGGAVLIEELAAGRGEPWRVDFQNEYLVAHQGAVQVAMVPDVISLIDDETAEPISADEARAGRHVVVLAFRADLRLTTEVALPVIGPAAFGYDLTYTPLEI